MYTFLGPPGFLAAFLRLPCNFVSPRQAPEVKDANHCGCWESGTYVEDLKGEGACVQQPWRGCGLIERFTGCCRYEYATEAV